MLVVKKRILMYLAVKLTANVYIPLEAKDPVLKAVVQFTLFVEY
jgi:hypothetical protein